MEILRVDDHTYLRGLREQDAPELFELVDSNRDRLSQWLPWVSSNVSEKETLAFILSNMRRRQENTARSFAIWHDEQICGVVGFNQIDSTNENAEIGYWICDACEGKGIMTAAVRTLTTFGFDSLGLRRIQIKCATENVRSQGIPERLAFTFEGTLRDAAKLNGEFLSMKLYSMLADEW